MILKMWRMSSFVLCFVDETSVYPASALGFHLIQTGRREERRAVMGCVLITGLQGPASSLQSSVRASRLHRSLQRCTTIYSECDVWVVLSRFGGTSEVLLFFYWPVSSSLFSHGSRQKLRSLSLCKIQLRCKSYTRVGQ